MKLRSGNEKKLVAKRVFWRASLFAFATLYAPNVYAACTGTPAGNEGDIVYNSTSHLMQYCNGTSWINMGAPSPIGFGTLTTNDFCTATSGIAISCTTGATGSGSVVLSLSPTLTGTVTGASSTWSGTVGIGTTGPVNTLDVIGTGIHIGSGTPGTTTYDLYNSSGTLYWNGTALPALNLAQTWTAAQTYTNSDLLLLGSSTGATTFTSANASATNYTLTFPAATANVVATTSTPAQGDILYYNGTNWVDLAAGTSGYFLKTQGAAANPVWAAASTPSGAQYQMAYFSAANTIAGLANITTDANGDLIVAPTATTTGTATKVTLTVPADTGMTAGAEAIIANWNSTSATRTHATGALTLQRDFVINGTTDAFAGASTLANGATLAIGYKGCGTSGSTCSNESALYIPTQTLTATGTITNSYGLNVAAASGATHNYAAVFQSGNVGIGTTAPAAALDVYASAGIGAIDLGGVNGISYPASDSTAGASIAIGAAALSGQTTSAAYGNTAIGYKAMGTGTIATGGIANTAVGYEAAQNLTSATQITAVGYQAGLTTMGGSSTAVGYQAGQTSMSSKNVAVGYQAGYSSMGQYSVAMGYQAGSTSMGTRSTAMGYGAGGASMGAYSVAIGYTAGNTTMGTYSVAVGLGAGSYDMGTQSIAVGYNAGNQNLGANSVAIGSSALGNSSSAANETAVGNNAGYSVTSGANNTLLGYQAGYDITTGAQNIAVGYFSTTGVGVSSGSNNILIGYDVRPPTASASNQLNIGNLIYGISLGTGATISTGSAGIGTTAPAARLDVYTSAGIGAIDLGGVNGISYPSTDATSIAIGSSALSGQTSSAAYGNTALGYQAMGTGTLTTNAKYNTALGYEAAQNVTAGTDITAVGYQAGQTSIGSYSVAVGYRAGQTSMANESVAIGLQAGQTSMGTNSVAMGPYAGYGNLGAYSIAVGYQTLSGTTSAANETAVGSNAGYSVTTGANNVLFGYQAGYDITTGAQNIEVGYFPNTGVGVSTGSNNIMIGYDVRPPSVTASNQLNIGNMIYGTSLGTGSTISTGSTGIGSSAPVATLDVETSTSTYDVYGNNTHAAGIGVYGNSSGTGVSYGVRGSDSSSTGYGGYFTNTGNGYGLGIGSGGLYITAGTPTATGNVLYSVGSTLYWNGAVVGGSGTTGTQYQMAYFSATNTLGSNANIKTDATGDFILAPTATTTGAPVKFTYSQPADTALTASTEAVIEYWNNAAATRSHATGALTLQRDYVITGATDAFVAASTLTNGATVAIGYKGCGAYGACTNESALYIPVQAITLGTSAVVTNSYGLNVSAATGATNNYAAVFQTGNVGIGTATPAYPLTMGSGAYVSTGGVWTNASDRRIKENIHPLMYGLDSVMKLKPVAYDLISTHEKQVGFVAQDVLSVVPEVVGVPKNPEVDHYGLSYGNMVAVTVKAIQELKILFDSDHQEVAKLKADNDNLRAANDAEASQIKALTTRLDALEQRKH